MRPRTVVIFFAAIVSFCPPAIADKWDEMVFIPARNGESAQIIDETGNMKAVIEGFKGARPQDCPPSAYWSNATSLAAVATGLIVSCDNNNEAYRLKETPEAAMKGGFALVPSFEPGPGTNDPGEMKKPVSGPEENP